MTKKKFKKVIKKGGKTKTIRYGQKGSRILPGTKKGDAYCSRSWGQMLMYPESAKDPNSPLRLSRAKWRCRGKISLRKVT
jgi:hypothetical protein